MFVTFITLHVVIVLRGRSDFSLRVCLRQTESIESAVPYEALN